MRARASRSLAFVALIACFLCADPLDAFAINGGGTGDTAVFDDYKPGQPGPSSGTDSGSHGGTTKLYRYSYLVYWPGSLDYCVRSRFTADIQTAIDANEKFVHESAVARADGGKRVASCPEQDQPQIADPTDFAGAVEQFWQDRMVMAHPTISVTPTNAVTGIPVYLTVDSELSTNTTLPDPVAGVVIRVEATSVYDVDWGDGEVETNVAQLSTGYPNGIHHTYQNESEPVIRLTQHWHLVWFADRFTGTIDTLFTSAEIDSLRVRDAETVLSNP